MKLDTLDLLGKPFKWGGRGPKSYDCYGLAMECARRVGKRFPDQYASTPDFAKISDHVEDASEHHLAELHKPEPFCFVTFVLFEPWVSHIGFVLADEARFIHVMAGCRVAVERLSDPFWLAHKPQYWRAAGE